MKKFFILILITLFAAPCHSQTILKGGIDYNVDSVKNELLSNYKNPISQKLLRDNAYDIHHKENITMLLKGKTALKDRTLALFSDTTYGVMYIKDPLHVYYYNIDGTLLYAEEKEKLDYPYKSYKYDITGKLVNMSLRVSKGETYIYTPNGILIAHWINSNGYDERGNIIMTRKYAY